MKSALIILLALLATGQQLLAKPQNHQTHAQPPTSPSIPSPTAAPLQSAPAAPITSAPVSASTMIATTMAAGLVSSTIATQAGNQILNGQAGGVSEQL